MPEEYKSIYVEHSYQCGDGKSTNAINYTITNKDSSVVIAFSFINLPDSNSLAMIRRFSPGWDPNKNYIKTAKNRADTLNHKLLFYEKDYSKRVLNADDAGEYVRACSLPYMNRYKNYRVIFLFKRDRGHIEITYFCTDTSKDKIGDYIKQTKGMLKYND
ncbi:MAG TPA: hypothetical protein DIT07_11515 [Sphingobacteriaceae bacterium]|nr:hypothetical protein [Sphingobacteriaceae bacterium]